MKKSLDTNDLVKLAHCAIEVANACNKMDAKMTKSKKKIYFDMHVYFGSGRTIELKIDTFGQGERELVY